MYVRMKVCENEVVGIRVWGIEVWRNRGMREWWYGRMKV